MSRRSSASSATGVGSLPGTDVREAVRVVFGELDVPHIPELPQRGPGADMVGRGLGLLVDLPAEWGPRGWRFADSPGVDLRRGQAWLREDLDALEEPAPSGTGPVKVQVCGPWTLLAQTELTSGHRAVRDEGAVRDVVAVAWPRASGCIVAEVRRRLPRHRSSSTSTSRRCRRCSRARCRRRAERGRVAAVEESVVQSRADDRLRARRSSTAPAWAPTAAPTTHRSSCMLARGRRCAVARPGCGRGPAPTRHWARSSRPASILMAGVVPSTRRCRRTVGRRR